MWCLARGGSENADYEAEHAPGGRAQARQSHFVQESPRRMSDVTADMKRPAVLGLKIQVTEFDVQVPLTATVEKLQHQAQIYRSNQERCAIYDKKTSAQI